MIELSIIPTIADNDKPVNVTVPKVTLTPLKPITNIIAITIIFLIHSFIK